MQILVLGMHRSGTSMVTRLINMMGAYFGTEEASTGANEENPKGFWERKDIRRLNDDLLFSVGADWYRILKFNCERVPEEARSRFLEQSRRVVLGLDGHRPWVAKEPRFCLTLPLWRDILEWPLGVVVLRNPVEIALSLRARNDFPLHMGVALWEAYIQSLLQNTRGMPIIVVHHSDLVQNPVSAVERLFVALQEQGARRLSLPSQQEIEAFIDSNLYRQRRDDIISKQLLSPYQQNLALQVASGNWDMIDAPEALSISAHEMLVVHEQAWEYARQRDELAKFKAVALEKAARLEETIAKKGQEASGLHEEIAEKINAEANTLEKVALLEETIAKKGQELSGLHKELEEKAKAEASALEKVAQLTETITINKELEEKAKAEAIALEKVAWLTDTIITNKEHEEKATAEASVLEKVTWLTETIINNKEQEASGLRKELDKKTKAEAKTRGHVVRLLGDLNEKSKIVVDHERTVADLENILCEKESEGIVLRDEIVRIRGDLHITTSWLRQLEHDLSDIFNSVSWRSGRIFVKIASRLLFRPIGIGAQEHIEQILSDIDAWHEAVHHEPSFATINYSANTIHPPLKSTEHTSAQEKQKTNPLVRWDQPPVTVLIPIFNAAEESRRCIESVLTFTSGNHKILLIDDASTDPSVSEVLCDFEDCKTITIAKNTANKGFVATVNLGLSLCKGDVIILNSDTEVTPHWLFRLSERVYSSTDIGTATPLTNNAGPFSVPIKGEENVIPAEFDLREFSRLVAQFAEDHAPDLPTGHGFCMYIRRALLDEIGSFDEQTFGAGYGEENDFCMRALKAGWRNVVSERSFVYHKRSASFGQAKDLLIKQNRNKQDQLHPEYTNMIRQVFTSTEFANVAKRIQNGLNDKVKPLPRILFVLHDGGGGTPKTNRDLMAALDGFECYLLLSDKTNLKLYRYCGSDELEAMEAFKLGRPWTIREYHREDYFSVYSKILCDYAIEIVHIRHLLAHSFDLVELAETVGIPIVLSFHDFYLACPTIQMIDSNREYCRGECRPQRAQCTYSKSWLNNAMEPLSQWNAEWRKTTSKAIKKCTSLVTTSNSAKSTIMSCLPITRDMPFSVIPHGRDFPINGYGSLRTVPVVGQPVRILIPGQLGLSKGVDFIKRIHALDNERKIIEFHFLGRGSENLSAYGISHGEYHRDEFYGWVKRIRPSFGGILSIWPETYCHTLTECWSVGLPVIATDIGVLRERINKTQGGWLIPLDGEREFLNTISLLANNHSQYLRVAKNVDKINFQSTAEMAKKYEEIYKALITG